MNSPTHQAFWRSFAQARAAVFNGFAMAGSSRHCFIAGLRQSSHDLHSLRCYPSPSSRSGPSQAGPILAGRRAAADRAPGDRYCFQIPDLAVESAAITTILRGSTQCRSRLSSSLFLSYPWQAACRTPHRAVWPVRPQAPLSPTRPRTTCLPVRLSAALPVSRPAASSLVCRPAARATDVTAFGRDHTTKGDHPGRAPGWSFAFSDGGSRCLTRS